jgi:hypothetical protein
MLAEVRDENITSRVSTGCVLWIPVTINIALGVFGRGRRERDRLCSGPCRRGYQPIFGYRDISAEHNNREHIYGLAQLYPHVNVELVDWRPFRPIFSESYQAFDVL